MTPSPDHLRITPTDDLRGYWLVSNGRTWFLSPEQFTSLHLAIEYVRETGREWKNYEEPKPSPIPFTSPRSNSLDDLI